MKLTEMRIYPLNNTGNQVIQHTVEGDAGFLCDLMYALKKRLDRNKISYIFKAEADPIHNDKIKYYYSLTKMEKKEALTFIPELDN